MKYKIDNIPIKELEIKFIATLENGETLNLLQGLHHRIYPHDPITEAYWEFSDKVCEMFGKDGNLPLSEIEDYAELHREESK